jgi:hypothetical protein
MLRRRSVLFSSIAKIRDISERFKLQVTGEGAIRRLIPLMNDIRSPLIQLIFLSRLSCCRERITSSSTFLKGLTEVKLICLIFQLNRGGIIRNLCGRDYYIRVRELASSGFYNNSSCFLSDLFILIMKHVPSLRSSSITPSS